jgi:hypothetical protein
MNQAQALPCEDLGKFVEYLDSVCVQIVFTCSPLNGIVGPRRPRPQRLRLFSLFVRTPEGLRRSQCPTPLTHTLVCSYGLERASGLLQRSGRYAQGDPRRLDGLRQKSAVLFRQRSGKSEGVVSGFLFTFPLSKVSYR